METQNESYAKEWFYLPLERRKQSFLNLIENKLRSRILFAPKILHNVSGQKLKHGNISKKNLEHVLKYRPRTPRYTVSYKFIPKRDSVRGRVPGRLQTNLHQSLVDVLQQEKYALLVKESVKARLNTGRSPNEEEFKTDESDSDSSHQERKSRKEDKTASQTLGAPQKRRQYLRRPPSLISATTSSSGKFTDTGVKVIRRRKRSPPPDSPAPRKCPFKPGGPKIYLFPSLHTNLGHKTDEKEQKTETNKNKQSFDSDTGCSNISHTHQSDFQISNVPTSNVQTLIVQRCNDKLPSPASKINYHSWDGNISNTNISIDNTPKGKDTFTVQPLPAERITDETRIVQSPMTEMSSPQKHIYSSSFAAPALDLSFPSLLRPDLQSSVNGRLPPSTSRPIVQPLAGHPLLPRRSPTLRTGQRSPRRLRRRRTRQSTDSVFSTPGFNALAKGGAVSQPLPEYSLRCIVSAEDILRLVTGARDSTKTHSDPNGRGKKTNEVETVPFRPLHYAANSLECAGDSPSLRNIDFQKNTIKLPLMTYSPTYQHISPCKNNSEQEKYVPGQIIRAAIRRKPSTRIKEKLLTDKLPRLHTAKKNSLQSIQNVKSKHCSSERKKMTNSLNSSTSQNDILNFPSTCFKHHFPVKKPLRTHKSALKEKTVTRSDLFTQCSPSKNSKKIVTFNMSPLQTVSTIKEEIAHMPFKDLQTCLSLPFKDLQTCYTKTSGTKASELVLKNVSGTCPIPETSNISDLKKKIELNASSHINDENLPFNKPLPKLPLIDVQQRLAGMKTIRSKKKRIAKETGSDNTSKANTDLFKTSNIFATTNAKNESSTNISAKRIKVKGLANKLNEYDGKILDKLTEQISKLKFSEYQMSNKSVITPLTNWGRRKQAISRATQEHILNNTERMDEMIRVLYQKKKKLHFPSVVKKDKPARHFDRIN